MRLFIMRHAAAEQNATQDFNRVLSETGKQEAAQAARFLKDYSVSKIVASYVKRAMQTANIIMESIPPTELEMATEFYDAGEDDVLNLITHQSDLNKSILLIGHNPLLYHLILSLIDKNDPAYETFLTKTVETAQITIIDFPELNDWSNLRRNSGKLMKIFVPERVITK